MKEAKNFPTYFNSPLPFCLVLHRGQYFLKLVIEKLLETYFAPTKQMPQFAKDILVKGHVQLKIVYLSQHYDQIVDRVKKPNS